MPTVFFTRPQQGYRPFMNPRPLAGLRGLRGGLGQVYVNPNICLDEAENSVPCSDPNCSHGDCGATGLQQTTGPLCLDEAENQIACADPGCKWGDCISPGTPSPAGVPATPSPTVMAGAPAGSYLTYTGQWQTTTTKSANDIIQSVLAALPGAGLGVVNFATSAGIFANTKLVGFAEAGQQFTVTIQMRVTGQGFAQPNDAGSIVDHLEYSASGQMPLSSNTVSAGGPASPVALPSKVPGADGLSFSTWLQQNGLFAVLGIAAVVLVSKKL